MTHPIPQELAAIVAQLEGLKCWHVGTGGAVGSTFLLALGERTPRSIPLRNQAHSDEFPYNKGSASILIWCAWRLDDAAGPITSWDDADDGVARGLAQVVGTKITSIEIEPPCWDATITFSTGLRLHVFCDHVPGEPSFDGNWQFSTPDAQVAFGPGARYQVDTASSLGRPQPA
jgi:hypothetical protein